MLTAEEIRRRYLAFFQRHQHEAVASGPLIPPNDKTLLFTNAGMVQFKKCFLGEEKRGYSRATTCQKCLRVSGKHNDLENVGRTARHHTFFEMLGNFSFGDYFKRDAITWAWQFVTEELELPKERLWVTVFRDDDEAAKLWEEVAGLPPERIVRMDEHDNFWTMGDTGPCGPCSEIYIDQGEDMSCGPDCGIGKCDCDRFLEIWNLVFTQYDQSADGSRVPLAAPNIDTGMGLERIAAVCQGKRSNFDCDLFQNLIQFAANLAHVSYSESAPDTNDVDTALRVIADHSRSAAFLVAEGVLPSNVGRGYVLRRLIRRALRFATLLGVKEPFLYQVSHRVTEIMGDAYPELLEHADFIKRVVHEEEERFSETLEKGLALLDEELVRLEKTGAKCVSGEFCFTLHDTHGFPLDIVNDVARKRGFSVDEAGFEKCMDEQRNRARANQKKGGLLGQAAGNMDAVWQKLVANKVACSFTGYGGLRTSARLTLLLDASGNEIANLGEGEQGYAITDATPFYGESGGQVGDTGLISSTLGEAQVLGTCKPAPSLLVHEVRMVRGELHVGEEVSLEVETERRQAIARNHSCTHLLHAALRKVLGTHVRQMGSLVDAERLRFDFSHIAAMTKEELSQVEHLVNKAILADMPVSVNEMAHDEAVAQGAMALFDEKYGDRVRVVSMGVTGEDAESVELCGGTHLTSTGQAGQMVIISESGVAAGIRRIEAVTGWNALQYLADLRTESQNLGQALKSKPGQMLERVKALQDEVKKLRKAAEKAGLGNAEGGDLLANAKEINGITLVCATLTVPVKALRTAMDDLRSRLPRLAVACLATNDDGKAGLILYVAKDLHDRFTAPVLIKEVAAPIGGSGGGRPDLAQAGGSNVAGIPDAFATLEKVLA